MEDTPPIFFRRNRFIYKSRLPGGPRLSAQNIILVTLYGVIQERALHIFIFFRKYHRPREEHRRYSSRRSSRGALRSVMSTPDLCLRIVTSGG